MSKLNLRDGVVRIAEFIGIDTKKFTKGVTLTLPITDESIAEAFGDKNLLIKPLHDQEALRQRLYDLKIFNKASLKKEKFNVVDYQQGHLMVYLGRDWKTDHRYEIVGYSLMASSEATKKHDVPAWRFSRRYLFALLAHYLKKPFFKSAWKHPTIKEQYAPLKLGPTGIQYSDNGHDSFKSKGLMTFRMLMVVTGHQFKFTTALLRYYLFLHWLRGIDYPPVPLLGINCNFVSYSILRNIPREVTDEAIRRDFILGVYRGTGFENSIETKPHYLSKNEWQPFSKATDFATGSPVLTPDGANPRVQGHNSQNDINKDRNIYQAYKYYMDKNDVYRAEFFYYAYLQYLDLLDQGKVNEALDLWSHPEHRDIFLLCYIGWTDIFWFILGAIFKIGRKAAVDLPDPKVINNGPEYWMDIHSSIIASQSNKPTASALDLNLLKTSSTSTSNNFELMASSTSETTISPLTLQNKSEKQMELINSETQTIQVLAKDTQVQTNSPLEQEVRPEIKTDSTAIPIETNAITAST